MADKQKGGPNFGTVRYGLLPYKEIDQFGGTVLHPIGPTRPPISQPAPSLSLKDHITLILRVGMQVIQKRARVALGGSRRRKLSLQHGWTLSRPVRRSSSSSSSSMEARLRAQMAEGR